MMTEVLRQEYPRPQMVRPAWENLNGEWDFAFDFGRTGRERNLPNAGVLERKILVPFCPESRLSGIEYKDMIAAVWYRRTIVITEEQRKGRVLLHFEAVDHRCHVWVNGQEAGEHTGGYTPFTFDITKAVVEGENNLVVYAEDDIRDPLQPRGKQAETYASVGCNYTRVTGIWGTVWLEFVPTTYITSYRCTPEVDNSSVVFDVNMQGITGSGTLCVIASYRGKLMGQRQVTVSGSSVRLELFLDELHLWQPLAAELYNLELVLTAEDGSVDRVTGYFGMRSLTMTDKAVLINGKPVFQRLVLDQGYYPDGIYTAPTDEAIRRDIELAIAAGFNGARMHQKVFDRRYLYWADRLGYLVWGEYGSWGFDISSHEALEHFLLPWMEAVERDYNSPALIGWCPLNETWDFCGRVQNDQLLRVVYRVTKSLDSTRPVIDTSGHYHVETDIFDVHDYEQDVTEFAGHYEAMKEGGATFVTFPDRQQYQGQPYFVSEYGGILWNEAAEEGWGYGNGPKSVEEFAERYEGLTKTLLSNPRIFGLCYTQLYDVEQEKNGLYTYERKPKFDEKVMARLREIMVQQAAIEM